MEDISKILTKEELEFIRKHEISPADIFDARGINRNEYHDIAKKNGCRFVLYDKCQNGHRLRTRSGHCIICRPASIAFMMRDSGKGVIYIAISGKYTKVGLIDNKRKSDKDLLEHREYQLNSEGGYGGRTGWQLIKKWDVDKNAGKIEREAHKILEKYKAKELYWYSGELREAQELFECSIAPAIDAVKKAMEHYL